MKDEKLKTCESQNSLKGKSTFENSKISDRIKSSKTSIKSKENPLPKKANKILIYKNSTKLENNNKIKDKSEKPKIKNEKLKKIIIKKNLSKTLLRTKISNKILYKTNAKNKIGLTPSQPVKNNEKNNKSILTMCSLTKIKENKNFNSKRANKIIKTNKISNNISVYKETFSTIQNSNNKTKKINNLKKNNKNGKNISNCSSEDLDEISLDIAPQIITDKMYINGDSKMNKTNRSKNKISNNKNEHFKKKLISLSKNVNKKNMFIEINTTMNQSYRNKTLNTSINNKNKNNNFLKQSFNTSVSRNYSLNNKIKRSNKKESSCLKTELNKYNDNLIDNKRNKIPKGGFNNCNYLKYTISALNKIVKKKTNNILKSSRIIGDKKNKTIKRKDTKNNKKYLLILRNTISRYKLYKKTDLFMIDDKPIKDPIKSPKSPNLLKYSTLHNSTKNYFNLIDNYKMLKSLGKGSYGEVKLALDKLTGEKYAIKIYPKKILDDPKKNKNIENEIKILKQLDNINIMKLHEVIKTDKFKYLILEYIEGISLLEIIKKEKNHYLEEKRALKIFIQIVKAIEYCQNKNICHRDIKLENVLTLKDDVIKIIDFGFAVKTNKETYQTLLCGSPSYMAPEIVKKEKYIAQYSDIWSLGILLYSMLFGRFPFKGKTQDELFEKIKKCEFDFPEEIKVKERIKMLIKKILVDIPTQRPSLNEILNEVSLEEN